MGTYKAIATISWVFDSEKTPEECLDYARSQLNKIVNCEPSGDEFDGFFVQMDLSKMNSRLKLIHVAEFDINDVFSYVTAEESKKSWTINGQIYSVKMNSDRYLVFKQNTSCAACGLQGTRMILDLNPNDMNPHFNLYGVEDERLILMTKDHIQPKSKGGSDTLDNFQTMCTTCNNLKGAHNLSLEHCRYLRRINKNYEKLPKKELRLLINSLREELSRKEE